MDTTSKEISKLLELLEILVSPHSPPNASESQGQDFDVDLLLKNQLCGLFETIEKDKYKVVGQYLLEQTSETVIGISSSSIRWQFVSICLKFLHCIRKCMMTALDLFKRENTPKGLKPSQGPPLSPDVLSAKQQKSILTCINFVVIFGISPNLEAGVGIPLEKRSEFASLFSMSVSKTRDVLKKSNTKQLFVCIQSLMECVPVPSIGALVLSRHLNDVLSGILQLLCHAKQLSDEEPGPLLEPQNKTVIKQHLGDLETGNNSDMSHGTCKTDFQKTPTSVVKVSTSQKRGHNLMIDHTCTSVGTSQLNSSQIELCEEWLTTIRTKVQPPMLVRELMLLQSGVPIQGPAGKPKGPVSPPWMRDICGRLLTDLLMRPNGVNSVLQGLLQGQSEINWKKCDAIAKVIACCPLKSTSVEEYYKLIAPQILALLHHSNVQIAQMFVRAAASTIFAMIQKHPEQAKMYILKPVFEPFTRCTQDLAVSYEKVVTSEEELILAVEDVYKIFVAGSESRRGKGRLLLPVLLPLFKLYCFVYSGISLLKNTCLEILTMCLKNLDQSEALAVLMELFLEDPFGKNVLPRLQQELSFATGDNGGVFIIANNSKAGKSTDEELDVKACVQILKCLQKDGLAGEFFIALMKELTQIIKHETTPIPDTATSQRTPPEVGKELMDIEAREIQLMSLYQRKISVLNLLAAVCEEIGPSCLTDTKQTLEFIKSTLERGCQVCKHTEDLLMEYFENETLTMAMGMLTAILTGTLQVTEEDREEMGKLIPLLEELSSDHPQESVQEMASDLKIAIATHGVIWTELLHSKKDMKKTTEYSHKAASGKKEGMSTKPLIEVLSSKTVEGIAVDRNSKPEETKLMKNPFFDATKSSLDTNKLEQERDVSQVKIETAKQSLEIQTGQGALKGDKSPDRGNNFVAEPDVDITSFQTAIKELQDPLLPVRGHALISLCCLLEKKDPETLNQKDTVMKIFQENLKHFDSYIYLAAINGLVAMASLCPEHVFQVLVQEFKGHGSDCGDAQNLPQSSFADDQKEKIYQRKVEDRIKVGECLVQTSRCLGPMSPRFRDVLLPCFLCGCRDQDPSMRASSLSNMGEICRVLGFSLDCYVGEIINCSCSILQTDSHVEVRQAAALMLWQLFQGLQDKTIQVMGSELKGLYRKLRLCMITEKEDKVKMQITLALNELDSIMKQMLSSNQKLEKKISVLDPI